MTIQGVWYYLKKKKTSRFLDSLPLGTKYHVDIFGAFYQLFLKHSLPKAVETICSRLEGLNAIIFIDGNRNLEKNDTHRKRDAK